VTEKPRLHVPNEPDASEWRRRVMEDATIDEVIEKEDGIAAWLWDRWRVLEGVGLDRVRFVALVNGYRRELWLWLMGERMWDQFVTGLAGRVARRVPGH
jgi:hypothetical protein